jgi:hypothetical protein
MHNDEYSPQRFHISAQAKHKKRAITQFRSVTMGFIPITKMMNA